MESLLGREVGKDARMLIILLKVYLQVLTSEFFQSITKLNISEAVNITFINENKIKLGGTMDVIVSNSGLVFPIWFLHLPWSCAFSMSPGHNIIQIQRAIL